MGAWPGSPSSHVAELGSDPGGFCAAATVLLYDSGEASRVSRQPLCPLTWAPAALSTAHNAQCPLRQAVCLLSVTQMFLEKRALPCLPYNPRPSSRLALMTCVSPGAVAEIMGRRMVPSTKRLFH